MKEKINRLARGIIDSGSPQAEIRPASFCESASFSKSARRSIEIQSKNRISVKGLCYSDNPRVQIENGAFAGEKCRIFFQIDTSFLKTGTVIYGTICLITNAGEFSIPYRFTAEGEDRYTRQKEENGIPELTAEPGGMYRRDFSGEQLSDFESFLLEHLPEDEALFSELAALLIRTSQNSLFAFRIYEEAIRRGLRLARLYEAYLEAFPDDQEQPMPKEVLLYFSYESGLPKSVKAPVYRNILLFEVPGSELYLRYEPEIRAYAMEALLQGKMDSSLSVIYTHMIYPDMLDEKAARMLPALALSQRFTCYDVRMSRLVIRYPELSGEEVYPLEEGRVFAPVYFPNAEILFLDRYGRYYRGADYKRRPAMERKDLLLRAFELAPAHPMVRLAAAKKIVEKGISEEQEKSLLLDAMRSLPLSGPFRSSLIDRLLEFGGSMAFLGEVDVDGLSGAQKKKIFSAFLRGGDLGNAYAMLKRYGLLIAESEDLKKLCRSMIAAGEVPEEEKDARFFLSALRRVFDEGSREKEVLSVLAGRYEGATEDMYAILSACLEQGVDGAELSERIMITKLFADVRTHLDEAFAVYQKAQPGMQGLIARAYLSVRAYDGFVREERLPAAVYDSLYEAIRSAEDQTKLPDIWLIAWTAHAAGSMREPDEEERKLLKKVTAELCREGLVFSYMGQLSAKGLADPSYGEKSYIEYHGDRFRKPRLLLKIVPEDTEFHEEEMRRVCQGVYVKEFRLFADDRLHYLIYDGSTAEEPVQEGELSGRAPSKALEEQSPYERLNRMTAELLSGDEEALRRSMQAYALDEEICASLFDVRERGV